MSHRLIERQVLYNGKKIRLELHHLENEDTGKRIAREIVVHNGAFAIRPPPFSIPPSHIP